MKRLFDLFVVLLSLPIVLPVALVCALLVWLRLGSPVFFTQRRAGLKGRVFLIYKFRTMTNERGPEGALRPEAERLTRFGQFLRSTSLDELPTLINVIKGEMSLVGPRPLHDYYLPHYSAEQARRHEVKPGVTGWAQIKGRNELGWEEKFALDCWYVDNGSFGLDLKILLLTVWKVMKREGIDQGGAIPRGFAGESGNGDADAG